MDALGRPPPEIRIEGKGEQARAVLSGDWTLRLLSPLLADIRQRLAQVPQICVWDLGEISRLDSFGSLLLWQHWGRRRPPQLALPDALEPVFARLAALGWRQLHGLLLGGGEGCGGAAHSAPSGLSAFSTRFSMSCRVGSAPPRLISVVNFWPFWPQVHWAP